MVLIPAKIAVKEPKLMWIPSADPTTPGASAWDSARKAIRAAKRTGAACGVLVRLCMPSFTECSARAGGHAPAEGTSFKGTSFPLISNNQKKCIASKFVHCFSFVSATDASFLSFCIFAKMTVFYFRRFQDSAGETDRFRRRYHRYERQRHGFRHVQRRFRQQGIQP